MTEQELRALVRDIVARQALRAPLPAAEAGGGGGQRHESHGQFAFLGPGPDGSCVIEPSVMCTHCGYCKSYGH